MTRQELITAIREHRWNEDAELEMIESGEWEKSDGEAFVAIGERLCAAGVDPKIVIEMLGRAYWEVAKEFGA